MLESHVRRLVPDGRTSAHQSILPAWTQLGAGDAETEQQAARTQLMSLYLDCCCMCCPANCIRSVCQQLFRQGQYQNAAASHPEGVTSPDDAAILCTCETSSMPGIINCQRSCCSLWSNRAPQGLNTMHLSCAVSSLPPARLSHSAIPASDQKDLQNLVGSLTSVQQTAGHCGAVIFGQARNPFVSYIRHLHATATRRK